MTVVARAAAEAVGIPVARAGVEERAAVAEGRGELVPMEEAAAAVAGRVVMEEWVEVAVVGWHSRCRNR